MSNKQCLHNVRRRLSPALALLLAACQVLSGPDTGATLQAERQGYIAEATVIAGTLAAAADNTQATAAAAGTAIAEMNSINQQLVATVRAAIVPTPARQVGDAVLESVQVTIAAGNRYFIKTGVAGRVRSSDGCAEDVRTAFSANESRIYATVRAFNIQAGTPMQARWYYQEQMVYEDGWSVTTSAADLCIWFFIEPSDVPFTPGNWSVRLFADGFQLEDPMFFTITAG